MLKAFVLVLKAFVFVLMIFIFLAWNIGYVEKGLDKKTMVNFKIFDGTGQITNNYNVHIVQYLKN